MSTIYYEKDPFIPDRKFQSANLQETDHYPERHRRHGEDKFWAWFMAVLPLAVHFLLICVVAIVVIFGVANHTFNVFSWRPRITQADGTVTPVSGYSPLQSDITTAISAGIAISRFFSSMWIAAMTWRCVFILLEKTGVSLIEINRILSFQLLLNFEFTRPSNWSRAKPVGVLVFLILLAAFPSQFAGPILTGSVTWSSSYSLQRGSVPLNDIEVVADADGWYWYGFGADAGRFPSVVTAATGMADIAYQDPKDNRTLKRVFRSAEYLPVNSRLENVTVPYFSVKSIEWLKDPTNELTPAQYRAMRNGSLSSPWAGYLPRVFVLLPDDWNGPPKHQPFPPPTLVSETRLLIGMHGRGSKHPGDSFACGTVSPFGLLPSGIGIYEEPSGDDSNCFIYAKVTYVAGAADCNDCRISSKLTVQNHTELIPKPDPMTREALGYMHITSAQMSMMNSSLPTAWNNLDGFVSELLIRSYSATWTAITSSVAFTVPRANTSVDIAVPMSKANVKIWRVLLWFVINAMVTVSGVLFIIIQTTTCQHPLAAEAPMTALLLDTSDLLHSRENPLCNFSQLTKEDKELGDLHLRQDPVTGHRDVIIE